VSLEDEERDVVLDAASGLALCGKFVRYCKQWQQDIRSIAFSATDHASNRATYKKNVHHDACAKLSLGPDAPSCKSCCCNDSTIQVSANERAKFIHTIFRSQVQVYKL